MQFLTVNLILDLQKSLIDQFGGLHGIRDQKLLESALAYSQFLYALVGERDVIILAAGYGYHLIKNHAFVDGNKRIGTLAMLTFLKINNTNLTMPNKMLYQLAMDIAESKLNENKLAQELRKYCSQEDAKS